MTFDLDIWRAGWFTVTYLGQIWRSSSQSQEEKCW